MILDYNALVKISVRACTSAITPGTSITNSNYYCLMS